ncbi:MAG: CPBP family intramembrane metalloprotease [Lentisphaerales bacterium]|jgi:membrane protease YdiL (CAAX protease family)|nr:MAG: CPBP family intramembrane metalloprotease [Lentisphaerales bacterium]
MCHRIDKSWEWLAVVVGLLFPGTITWLYFFVWPGAAATTLLYAANKVFMAVFPFLLMKLVLRRPIGLTREHLKCQVAAVVSGLAMLVIILVVYAILFRGSPILADVPAAIFAKATMLGVATPSKFLAFALFMILINSALEEYYWRWFVFGALRDLAPTWVAVTVSSIGFTFHHVVVLGSFLRPSDRWPAALGLSACVAVAGAIWAALYHRTGSIVGPWISHVLADVAVIVVGFDMLRGYLC